MDVTRRVIDGTNNEVYVMNADGSGPMNLTHDAARYDGLNAALPMPVQVFQGRRDTAVDPETLERWASTRPNVELHMLDDDHQLLSSLPYIWQEMERFMFTPSAR